MAGVCVSQGLGNKHRSLVAVSYTHLDVYKRQSLMCSLVFYSSLRTKIALTFSSNECRIHLFT